MRASREVRPLFFNFILGQDYLESINYYKEIHYLCKNERDNFRIFPDVCAYARSD